MAKTYADIEDRVLKNINSTTADVSYAIDNAIDFLGNFYENYKIDISIATVASQDYILTPAQCKEVERLEIDGEQYEKGSIAKIDEIKEYELKKFIEYDGKINIYPTPTEILTTKIWYKSLFTPLEGVAAAETDIPDQLVPLLVSVATWFFLEQQENMYDYTGADGWIDISDEWTFDDNTDDPVFTAIVPIGAGSLYQAGMKIKLTQTSVKYFIILKVENNKLYLYGGTDYELTDAVISNINYSTAKAPMGFPGEPAKWTISKTDTVRRVQSTPTSGVYYNIGGTNSQITIPPGGWRVSYQVAIGFLVVNAQLISLQVGLSEAADSLTDPAMSNYKIMYHSGSSTWFGDTFIRQKLMTVVDKTLFYLVASVAASSGSELDFLNDNQTLTIEAVCAYI